jgi:hypothetical protein
MVKFKNGASVNVGELKHLIEVKSKKITDPKERVKKLILDFAEVKSRLDQFKNHIEKIEVQREEKSVEIENFYSEKDEYLFSWDIVPGNDNEKLLKFLMDKLDIVWAKNAEISKSDDKTIHISKNGNSAEIMMDAEEEKATLKISGGNTHKLKVKKENGMLNIYKDKTVIYNPLNEIETLEEKYAAESKEKLN